MKILIANRGEIARRIIATAHRLGHQTVAVFADPDESEPFVAEATEAIRIGPGALAESYLSIDRLAQAVVDTGADAVHPGYGFLSENADFARAVVAAGAVWIGPHAAVIESMGSKITARALAEDAGLPVIPGYSDSQSLDALAAAAAEIGYPVLVKAAAGGGGKGIRLAHDASDFESALAQASAEADRAFGDGDVIVERYIERPRHIEVQIIGDHHGNVVHLGTRECSVQRRYQKVLEEAPAPNLPAETRTGLQDDAVALGRAVGYDSAGTVEFIVDDTTGEHFFLEMNTRLQVEHPVTEAVTRLDIVELQISSASGNPVPTRQADVSFEGHSIEVRVNAEDPSSGFAPQVGSVTHLSVPRQVRWDSAIVLGSVATTSYDSMIAKLIVHDHDRPAALARLAEALDQLIIGGVGTNTGLLRWLVDQKPIVEARVTTRFLDEVEVPAGPPAATADAANSWAQAMELARVSDVQAWRAVGSFRLTPHRTQRSVALAEVDGSLHETPIETPAATPLRPTSVDLAARSVAVNVAGHTQVFTVPSRTERWAPTDAEGHGHARAVIAPFPAVVTEIHVAPGDHVAAGDTVCVVEAMKMLHNLQAAGPGVVEEVRASVGDQVSSSQVLVTFLDEADPSPVTRGEQ